MQRSLKRLAYLFLSISPIIALVALAFSFLTKEPTVCLVLFYSIVFVSGISKIIFYVILSELLISTVRVKINCVCTCVCVCVCVCFVCVCLCVCIIVCVCTEIKGIIIKSKMDVTFRMNKLRMEGET